MIVNVINQSDRVSDTEGRQYIRVGNVLVPILEYSHPFTWESGAKGFLIRHVREQANVLSGNAASVVTAVILELKVEPEGNCFKGTVEYIVFGD